MGLFGKKKSDTSKPVEEKSSVTIPSENVCCCCGNDAGMHTINWFDTGFNYAGYVKTRGKRRFEEQCNYWGFKFGDNILCGWCFSKLVNNMTGEVLGPEDYLLWEEYKTDHISKSIADMTVEELQGRKDLVDQEVAKLAEEKKAQEDKEKEEWLKTLK